MILINKIRATQDTKEPKFSKEACEASEPHPNHLIDQRIDLINCRRLLDILSVIAVSNKAYYEDKISQRSLDGAELAERNPGSSLLHPVQYANAIALYAGYGGFRDPAVIVFEADLIGCNYKV